MGVGCVHLLFNLMPILCSVLFQYWMARPRCFCLPSPSRHSTAGHSSACLWLMWHHPMVPLQGQLHWPHLNLREMGTKGSLKQGQLNFISFLCSPKAESGSFRSCASSPEQLLWICLQRSLPLFFSPTAMFHKLGVIPLAQKGGWFSEY